MSSQILGYIDDVIAKTEAPNEVKVRIENELIRSIIEASESTSMDEVKRRLCSPERLAEELSKKIAYKDMTEYNGSEHNQMHKNDRPPRQRYGGEFMREESNVNLKLLYIPLIQISSGTQRITMPLTEDY